MRVNTAHVNIGPFETRRGAASMEDGLEIRIETAVRCVARSHPESLLALVHVWFRTLKK